MKYLILIALLMGCNSPKQSDIDRKQDSTILALSTETQYLKDYIAHVEKEQRTTEYYLNQDLKRLQFVCDSLAVKDPKTGKGWRIVGQVIGEVVKRVVPGL